MDTRRLLITIVIAVGAMFAFQYISKMWSPNKHVAPASPAVQYTLAAGARPVAEDNSAPATLRLGDPGAGSKDKVAITINNITAGIDRVELNVNDYTQDVKSRAHPVPEPLLLMQSADGMPKAFATLRVSYSFPGGEPQEVDLYAHQFIWKMERDPKNAYQANLRATINYHDKPAIEITKIFRIDPESYDIVISHQVRNLTDQPVKVAIDQMTSLDLPADETQPGSQSYQAAGLDTAGKLIVPNRFTLAQTGLNAIEATRTQEIGKFSGADPLVWVANSNRFFAALTRPTEEGGKVFGLFEKRPDGSQRTIPVVDHVAAAHIDILYPSAENMQPSTDVTKIVAGIRLSGAPVEVAPGTSAGFPLSVFLGPKKEKTLQGDIHAPETSWQYVHALFRYGALIQFSSGGCYSQCTFDWLAYLLLHILDFLKSTVAFGNYGVAIVILVLLIRAALHPLTRMSQIKMAEMGKKMKDIQPLIEANKKKYAKDKQKQNEEMMRIYREHNVNPAGGVMGCLPMLLQMPIWVAMYSALRTDILLRHAVFVPGWINDLSAPDMTVVFPPVPIPLTGMHISALNLLPILLGIVSFVQMKVQLASQPKPADEQQASMQKMSSYMILILPIFLYNQPSGLNLYYFGSMAGGLIDTYLVRKTLKKKGILPATAQMLPTHEE